jgi:hypothetical protein
MDSCLHSGLNWLMRSGIQHPTGAVFGEYDSLTASYKRVSTEAAAWSIQAVLGLGEPTDEVRRNVAISAGRYLMERSFDLQSDLFVDDPTAEPRLGSFMSGVAALRALNALWRATGDSAYSECADRCGRSIQVRMTRVDGSFFKQFNASAGHAGGEGGGPEQLKAAAAFLELAEDGGMAELRGVAESLLKFALARHEGFADEYTTDIDARLAKLRRYALFLEGLLPFAAERLEAGSALQAGIVRLEKEAMDVDPAQLPPELLAQPLRLRLFADLMGLGELDRSRAEAEADLLREYQLLSSDPSLDGAFGAVRDTTEIGASLEPHPTVVSLQALEFWNDATGDGFRRTWRDLI